MNPPEGSNHDHHRQPPADPPPSPQNGTAKNSVHLVLVTDHYDEEIQRLTGLGARPLSEIKLPAVRTGGATFSVSQTTFADPESNEFELVNWATRVVATSEQ